MKLRIILTFILKFGIKTYNKVQDLNSKIAQLVNLKRLKVKLTLRTCTAHQLHWTFQNSFKNKINLFKSMSIKTEERKPVNRKLNNGLKSTLVNTKLEPELFKISF